MPVKKFIKSLIINALLIKSKLFQWLSKPKWLNRLTLYSFLFPIVITPFHFIFSYFDLLHTDVNSARYMLSALVQSEAAIVALVVTLSLVAMQLAASSYSARVIEVFRRTPDLWILMGIYGIAIFYAMGVLKLIENPPIGRLSNLEEHVAFSYYLGIFAFVVLVPYIWKTLEMLKPSTVINILAKEINKKNILFAVQEDREEMEDGNTSFSYSRGFPRIKEDPILPIIDIVRSSLMKFDFETVKEGLNAIRDRIDYILINETFTEEEERRVSIYIFNHLTAIGKLAASRKDEVSIFEVINCMQKIGIRGAMGELTNVTFFSTYYLTQIFHSLRFVQFEGTIKVADSLYYIGRIATVRRFEIGIEYAVESLEKIGINVAKHKSGNAILIISHLEILLERAKKQNLSKATQQIEDCIKKVNEAQSKSEK